MQLKVVIVDKNNKIILEFPQSVLQELLDEGLSLDEIVKLLKNKTRNA